MDIECYKCKDCQDLGLGSKCPYCGEQEIRKSINAIDSIVEDARNNDPEFYDELKALAAIGDE